MTSTPDRPFLPLLLAGALSCAAFGALFAGPLAAAPGEAALAEAADALERGNGVAAEVAAKRALAEGATRADVAAFVGEGELMQGDLADARTWLGGQEFSPSTRPQGLQALARLEIVEGNLGEAAALFDTIIAEGGESALLWVDIGRLRYRAGQHHLALEAARKAVELGPQEARALEFLAQLVRDSEGVGAALPLFRRALEGSPDDLGLMQQYAATLGDAGEHAAMLAVVRALLEDHPDDPFAFYLQSVLAARAGQDDLARRLWWRTEGQFDETAAGLTVTGVLEYRSGNPGFAVEVFDKLRRMQPFNDTALLMYARALVANGEANVAIALIGPQAQRPDASPYMLVLAGRAHEQLGQRAEAAEFLDRAAMLSVAPSQPLPAFLPRDGSGRVFDPENPLLQLRQMLAEGQAAQAQARVSGLLQQFAGSADLEVVAGDVHLVAGDAAAALALYRQAAKVRRDWPLVQRMVAALTALGSPDAARAEVADYLAGNPRQQPAAALLGRMQREAGNPARATVLLRQAAGLGPGGRDALLLADLAEMEAVIGNGEQAMGHAAAAHALYRGNRRVARVLARIEAMQGSQGPAQVLGAKGLGQGIAPVDGAGR